LSERFIYASAEDIAKVSDGGHELRGCGDSQRAQRKTGDRGRRFEASETIQEHTDARERAAQARDVARVVVIAHGQRQMVERRDGDRFSRFKPS